MLTYFGFKETLGSFDSFGGDINFGQTSEDRESTVLCQLSRCSLPEDQQELDRRGITAELVCGILHCNHTHYRVFAATRMCEDDAAGSMEGPGNRVFTHLPEAQLVVQVLVHLLDHVLQAKVSLRSSQLLHHQLQLIQVDVIVSLHIVAGQNPGESKSAGVWAFQKHHIFHDDHDGETFRSIYFNAGHCDF